MCRSCPHPPNARQPRSHTAPSAPPSHVERLAFCNHTLPLPTRSTSGRAHQKVCNSHPLACFGSPAPLKCLSERDAGRRRGRAEMVRADRDTSNGASERKCLELTALWCARPAVDLVQVLPESMSDGALYRVVRKHLPSTTKTRHDLHVLCFQSRLWARAPAAMSLERCGSVMAFLFSAPLGLALRIFRPEPRF